MQISIVAFMLKQHELLIPSVIECSWR